MKNRIIALILLLSIIVGILPSIVFSAEVDTNDEDNAVTENYPSEVSVSDSNVNVNKSANWTNSSNTTAEIHFSVNVSEMEVPGQKATDVFFVADTSGSMEGDRINSLITSMQDCSNSLLTEGSNNRVALVTFSDKATVSVGLTSDKAAFISQLGTLRPYGGTNYYAALKTLMDEVIKPTIESEYDNSLEKYKNERYPVVVFLSDGLPNVNLEYNSLIYQEYAKMNIPVFGLQYMMGSSVTKEFKEVCDFPFNAPYCDALEEVSERVIAAVIASNSQFYYENVVLTDYINETYFTADTTSDIILETDFGKAYIEGNRVTWEIGTLFAGINATLSIRIALKEDSSGKYPFNLSLPTNDDANDNGQAALIACTDPEGNLFSFTVPTPYLPRYQHTVSYRGGLAQGTVFKDNEYLAADSVTVLSNSLEDNAPAYTLDGYNFNGWKVICGDGLTGQTYFPGDNFVMPDCDVMLEAIWGKPDIGKVNEELRAKAMLKAGICFGSTDVLTATFGSTSDLLPIITDESQYLNANNDIKKKMQPYSSVAQSITKVVFTTRIPDDSKEEEMEAVVDGTLIDVNEEGYGIIKSWLEYNEDGKTYTLYIGSNGTMIYWNPNSSFLFCGLLNCKEFVGINSDEGICNTSEVTNMSYLFAKCCENLESFSLDNRFDTSSVTNTRFMFLKFGMNMSTASFDFDTSNVTDMTGMFSSFGYNSLANAKGFQLGEHFKTDNVTDMSFMFFFFGYSSMESFSFPEHFNTASVTNMRYMFAQFGVAKLKELDLKYFNTSNVTNMAYMFYYCGKNEMTSLSLGEHFFTSNVTNMSHMFHQAGQFKMTSFSFTENFDTSNVTNMSYMFYGFAQYFKTFDLRECNFDTSKVTDMSYMFASFGTSSIGKGKLEEFYLGYKFDTSNVQNMQGMFSKFAFYSHSKFNVLDLGNWFDTSNVYNMKLMFEALKQGLTIDFGHKFYVFSDQVYEDPATAAETNVVGMFHNTQLNSSYSLDLRGIKWNETVITENGDTYDSPAKYKNDGVYSFIPPSSTNQRKIIFSTDYMPPEEYLQENKHTLWLASYMSQNCQNLIISYETYDNPCYTLTYIFDDVALAAGFIAPKTEYASAEDVILVQAAAAIPEGYRFLQWVPTKVMIDETMYELSRSIEQENTYTYSIDGVTYSITINPAVGYTFTMPEISIIFEGQWTANAAEPTSSADDTIDTSPYENVEEMDDASEQSQEKNNISSRAIIDGGEVKEGDSIVYTITVSYHGTEGGKSGVILIEDEIPEHLTFFSNSIVTGTVARITADGGQTFGSVVKDSFSYDPETRKFSFRVVDLSVGAKISVSITCSVDPLEEGVLCRDYYNNARALENDILIESDTVHHYINATVPSYTVSYLFTGDFPIGFFSPATKHYEVDQTVSVEPISDPIPEGYLFGGWIPYSIEIDEVQYPLTPTEEAGVFTYSLDGQTQTLHLATEPGDTFLMPQGNIVFVGKWTVDEEKVSKVSVGYSYEGTIPAGAPDLANSHVTKAVGSVYSFMRIDPNISRSNVVYTFSGWNKLVVEYGETTQEVPLTDGVFKFTLEGLNHQINTAYDSFNTTGYPDNVKLTFIGNWTAESYNVNYLFTARDENGNEASDELMQALTANGNIPVDDNEYYAGEEVSILNPARTVVVFEDQLWVFNGWTSNDVIFSNGFSSASAEETALSFTMPAKDVTLSGNWSTTDQLQNDTIVMDYGKPILADVLLNDRIPQGYTAEIVGFGENAAAELEGEMGHFSVSDGKVVYRPTAIMTTIERMVIHVNLLMKDADGQVLHSIRACETLKIIPATSVYYESDYSSEAITLINNLNPKIEDGVVRSDWVSVGDSEEAHYQDDGTVGNGQTYGFDSSYQNDAHFSNGSSLFVEGQGWTSDVNSPSGKTYFTTVEFSFTGTGFEIISMTNDIQSFIFIEIYSSTGGKKEHIKTVNVLCSGKEYGSNQEGPTLYQVPVARIEGLAYGSYTILVGVGSSIIFNDTLLYDDDFHFDAIRIFDPILPTSSSSESTFVPSTVDQADAYAAYVEDGEADAYRVEVRNLLLEAKQFHPDELSELDGIGLVTFIEDNFGTDNLGVNIADYEKRGPNNEVYLVYGQGIAFATELPPELASLDVGLKCAYNVNAEYEIALYVEDENYSENNLINEVSKIAGTLASCSDQKISVPLPQNLSGKVYVVIRNATMDENDKGILSITDIRFAYGKQQTSSEKLVSFMFDSNVLQAASQCLNSSPVPGDAEIRNAHFTVEQCTVMNRQSLTVTTSTDVRALVVSDHLGNVLDVPISYYDTNTGERIWNITVLIMLIGDLEFNIAAYCARNESASVEQVGIISAPYAAEEPFIIG